jgi:hypothetical protein
VKSRIAALTLAAAAACAAPAFAWGQKGHTMVSDLGAKALATQQQLPAFLTSGAAVYEIAYLGPEEDRLKGAGPSWDADNDPGHYLDIDDNGSVAGGWTRFRSRNRRTMTRSKRRIPMRIARDISRTNCSTGGSNCVKTLRIGASTRGRYARSTSSWFCAI